MRELCGGPRLELHQAVSLGDVAEITALLAQGADISEADSDGQTPLHLAIAAGALPMVQELLKIPEGDPNALICCAEAFSTHNSDGLAPLHIAAKSCSAAIVTVRARPQAGSNRTPLGL